ncbi:hypothetical protein [Bacillus pumilus]|uniref:hypothetical protein n=1 Tax=Bacillus pumilus TaxID=1408 RepID=UPI0007EECBD5|nr:hypothetical protein [Bacillus pumilus]OBS85781.1 hypothetical protein BAY68_19370 [Bacillus pumilus]
MDDNINKDLEMAGTGIALWYEPVITQDMINTLALHFDGTLVYENEKVIGLLRYKHNEYSLNDLERFSMVIKSNITRVVHSPKYTFVVCLRDKKY